MIPFEVLKPLLQERIEPDVRGTYRSYLSYRDLGQQQVREADFETLMAGGLVEDIETGAGRILQDTGRYVFFARLKTASNAPFDTMINCFPHEGVPIAHTLDELPPQEQQNAFNWLEKTTQAVAEIAERHHRPLRRVYIEQHLGPGEVKHMEFYRTAYPQAHFHVYGVPLDFPRDDDVFHPSSLVRKDRTTFFEPTIYLAWDLIQQAFPEQLFELNESTSSIELKLDNSLCFSKSTRDFIVKLMSLWKEKWHQLASCFTNFSPDQNDRHIPLLKAQRLDNIEQYIADNPFLSNKSQIILRWLADSLQLADFTSERRKMSHFFKDIAGSWGVIADMETKERRFIFSPRTWVMSQRGGSTDGHLINQDRSKMLTGPTQMDLISIQKELIAAI